MPLHVPLTSPTYTLTHNYNLRPRPQTTPRYHTLTTPLKRPRTSSLRRRSHVLTKPSYRSLSFPYSSPTRASTHHSHYNDHFYSPNLHPTPYQQIIPPLPNQPTLPHINTILLTTPPHSYSIIQGMSPPLFQTLHHLHHPFPSSRALPPPPPPNLYKTLLYTIFDAFHPIIKILFSIQTLLIFLIHIILTFILFVYFSPPFPDLNTYTHPPTNYWLLFFLLYLPFSLFLAILSYFLRLLKLILYSASSLFKRAIHFSFSYILSQYTINFYFFKISYLYPIANFFYTLAIGPNNSYLPPRIKQYIIYKMAPRTRSLTRSSPDDPNNPTDETMYQNPNRINRPPRTIHRTVTTPSPANDQAFQDATNTHPLTATPIDEEIETNCSHPLPTTHLSTNDTNIPQLIENIVFTLLRRHPVLNEIHHRIDQLHHSLRQQQSTHSEPQTLTSTIPYPQTTSSQNTQTTPPTSLNNTQTMATNSISAPPQSSSPTTLQQSPQPQIIPPTPHDEPLNIRTVHLRASALLTAHDFEAFARQPVSECTPANISIFVDRLLHYLQHDHNDLELNDEARALTKLSQHLSWEKLAACLRIYSNPTNRFTYGRHEFWRKQLDIYATECNNILPESNDLPTLLRRLNNRLTTQTPLTTPQQNNSPESNPSNTSDRHTHRSSNRPNHFRPYFNHPRRWNNDSDYFTSPRPPFPTHFDNHPSYPPQQYPRNNQSPYPPRRYHPNQPTPFRPYPNNPTNNFHAPAKQNTNQQPQHHSYNQYPNYHPPPPSYTDQPPSRPFPQRYMNYHDIEPDTHYDYPSDNQTSFPNPTQLLTDDSIPQPTLNSNDINAITNQLIPYNNTLNPPDEPLHPYLHTNPSNDNPNPPVSMGFL